MSDNDLSFGFELQPTGDDGSTFRYRNLPNEYQRSTVVDRRTSIKSNLSVQGSLVTVVHGKFAPGGPRATLIVARLELMSSHHCRRFSSAKISFHFRNNKKFLNSSVHKIAPSGEIALNQSWYRLEEKVSAGGGGGLGIHPLAADVQAKYELTKALVRPDCGSLYGSTTTEGRSFGPKNTARWSMSQNESEKSGIPTHLYLAILLKRDNDEPFFADVKVNAEVDVLYKLESWIQDVGGKNKIDPIKFDPRKPPMGVIPNGLDKDNLSEYPLERLGRVETTPSIDTRASAPHSYDLL
jgi:hypothetical protein